MTGLFKTPKAPKVIEPTPLPDVDDQSIKRAKKKTIARTKSESGRTNTFLSNNNLGGAG